MPNVVLAIVLASAVITTFCAFVVVSNALHGKRHAEHFADAQDLVMNTAPQRRNPDPTRFETTVSITIDRAPNRFLPPPMAPNFTALETVSPAPVAPAEPFAVEQGRPSVTPEPRPGVVTVPPVVRVVAVARNMDADRAHSLPRPAVRPIGTTTPDWPDMEAGPQTSVLPTISSPRPSPRPADLITRVSARAQDFEIDVARAEAPDTLGDLPDTLGDLPGTLGDLGESIRSNIFSSGGGNCTPHMARQIPRRPGSAASGSDVMASVGNSSGADRDNRMVQEALSGNVPNYIRNLRPVTFNGTVGGRTVEVTICATPDYLAIGSDRDHVRVPLGLPAALRMAEAFDMMLPTTTMVDAIYQQADIRVAPSPMTPGSSMSSTSYFLRHNDTIEGQFARAGVQSGMLVAGHKKDLVLANRLSRNPGRVAIYGWHRSNGHAIQPLSTVHGEYYADYSHGIRLVSRTAFVDGRAVDLRELLTDERYAGFLNSDGALSGATVRLASL